MHQISPVIPIKWTEYIRWALSPPLFRSLCLSPAIKSFLFPPFYSIKTNVLNLVLQLSLVHFILLFVTLPLINHQSFLSSPFLLTFSLTRCLPFLLSPLSSSPPPLLPPRLTSSHASGKRRRQADQTDRLLVSSCFPLTNSERRLYSGRNSKARDRRSPAVPPFITPSSHHWAQGGEGGVRQTLSSQPSSANEWAARGGRREMDTTGMEEVTAGEDRGKKEGEWCGRQKDRPVMEGGRGETDRGEDWKRGGRGRDIVMGHPEEVECQEAISLLSAGVMPLLFHPMLNTC